MGQISPATDDIRITNVAKGLQRHLTANQLNMLAFSGAIGTGLIIGTGSSLQNSGPGNLVLAFLVMGLVVQGVMTALGEMATNCPMKKGFAGYATRFVDPALGFATGWNYFFKYIVLQPTNLTATGLLLQYWFKHLNVGIWIAVFGTCIVFLNIFDVKYYGRAQLYLGIIKGIVMLMMIIACIVVSAGGGPTNEKIGFRYWKHDAFKKMDGTGLQGGAAHFAAFWYSMVQATFAYTGVEIVGASFGEVQNPKKSIPKAIMMTPYRIVCVYIIGVFALSISVASNNDMLLAAVNAKTKHDGGASPFVIAVASAGIRHLPDVWNGLLLVFTLSAANADVYTAARTLHGLSKDSQAPKIFNGTNKWGVPIWAVGMSSIFICIGFLNCVSSTGAVFNNLVNVTVVLGALNWLNILLAYFGWYRARRAQGKSRNDLTYRGVGQPYLGIFSFCMTGLVIVTSSYQAWLPIFPVSRAIKIVTCYVGLGAYLFNITLCKLLKKTKRVNPAEADLNEEDEDDEVLPVVEPVETEDTRKISPPGLGPFSFELPQKTQKAPGLRT
ncbi:hypothetical protein EJ08DRAFT_596418 [Tothia fuscella]|uniref:Amino acid permease/ SLC12A domain-containing protein n=1 Tax=Tothia fuscella TaxID=1048955 RepID=A0A9P4NIZ5_9PEZI|nr:hypothetical protein EJ08DRAFT_596418 [Tothia fuscella]